MAALLTKNCDTESMHSRGSVGGGIAGGRHRFRHRHLAWRDLKCCFMCLAHLTLLLCAILQLSCQTGPLARAIRGRADSAWAACTPTLPLLHGREARGNLRWRCQAGPGSMAPCLASFLLLALALAFPAAEATSRAHLLPRQLVVEGRPPAYLPVVLWHGEPLPPPPLPLPSPALPAGSTPLLSQAPAKYTAPLCAPTGMGDSCCNPHSMGAVQARIEAALPGIFVHSVATGASEDSDVLSGYFGNLNEQARTLDACRHACGAPVGTQQQRQQPQKHPHCVISLACTAAAAAHTSPQWSVPALPQVERVCDQLLGLEQLQHGYVAVGFSQVGSPASGDHPPCCCCPPCPALSAWASMHLLPAQGSLSA